MNDEPKNQKDTDPEALLWKAGDVARRLNLSVRTVWSLDARGNLPAPVRIPGCKVKLWHREELIRWLDAGAPPRREWEAIKISFQENRRKPLDFLAARN